VICSNSDVNAIIYTKHIKTVYWWLHGRHSIVLTIPYHTSNHGSLG